MREAKVELSKVLDHIAAELIVVDTAARTRSKPVMQFDECEIEFAVKVEMSGQAGIKVWVLEIGGGGKHEHSNKIKVKFKSIPGQSIQAVQHTPGPGPTIRRQSKSR